MREIEKERLRRLAQSPQEGSHPMVLLLAKVFGVGIETADMLVNEVPMRNLRDERALGRYAGITGSPDESGSKRREKGLSRAGNARVRRGMVQLAWRWLMFQKESPLTKCLVLRPNHKWRASCSQENDRGLSPQAADRAVAVGEARRGACRHQIAAGDMIVVAGK